MNAIKLILAQKDRDGRAENCQNRQEPGCAVSPGLGGLRILPPRMLVRCHGGDALVREVVPISLTLPQCSAPPVAASSVPVLNARSLWWGQSRGFGTKTGGHGGGSRTRHETGEETLKN